uniref:C2H2-type domain-containing protein n=1 Tax=Bactrocera latifrons TaxID=174628 RepID=A0A0K8ULR7_BACLA
MGDTQNELSQFGELEFTKCGEIKMCAKRYDFQLSCVHCDSVFSQMAVFARHLYWEHQLGCELQGKERGRNDLSIYTVEELLTNKNIENTSSDNENICNTTSDEDDTGFGSDEELEKEIQELLTSIASANSSCNNETEYSENVSSFEHTKNMHGSDKNLQEKDINRHKINLQKNFGSEASKESDTADAKILPKIITIVSKNVNDFGRSIVNTKTNGEVHMNYTSTDPKKSTNFIKKSNYTKEEVNYSEHKETKSENAAQFGKKLPLKQYLESKNFLLQSDDESRSNIDWPKKCTGNKRKDFVSSVLKLNTNEMLANQNKLEKLPNIGDIESVRSALEDQTSNTPCSEKKTNKEICIEKDCNNIFTLSEDLLLSNASNEEENYKKGNNSSVQDKETILMKTNSTEEKLIEIKYDAPTMNDYSSYHKAYISYLETNENCGSTEETISQQSKSTTHEMNIEKPLDLSFNKSNEWADMELEEISELLSIDEKATTELITQELDKLLVQQHTNYTDNPTSLLNSDQLQISDIVVDNLLPPFSKFFTNNENTLKNSNNFMTQSTPKEKNKKTKDLAIKTTKTKECISTGISPISTENVENVIPEHKMHTFCRNLQRRFKISKRVTQCDENEKKSKKSKQDHENTEIMQENNSTKKPDIEILSVDIILPNENENQNASANFGKELPAENNVDVLQIPSVIQKNKQSR